MAWCAKCCCCHLKGGAIAIGVVFLVLNVLGAASSAIGLTVTNVAANRSGWGTNNAFMDVYNKVAGASLAFYVISAITDVLLFIPACVDDERARGRKWCLVPFLAWMILQCLVCLGFAIFMFASVPMAQAAFIAGIYIVFIILGIYCWIMVFSYFQYLRDYVPGQNATQQGGVILQQPGTVVVQQGYPPQQGGQPMMTGQQVAYAPQGQQGYPPQGYPQQGQPMMAGQPMSQEAPPQYQEKQGIPEV